MRAVVIASFLVGCGAAVPAGTPARPATIPFHEEARVEAPAETCASIVEAAIVAEAEGRVADARAGYARAIELDRRCVPAMIDLARLARRAEPGSAEAERLLARAIEIDGRSLAALDQLALVHLERGELELAGGVVDRALAIDPDHALAHETRALVAMRRGDVHAALESLDRAIALAPSFEALMNRAGLEIDFRDHAGAERDYRAAIEIRPESYEAWLGMGVALRGLERIDDARAAYERARMIDPDRAEAYYDLGVLHSDDTCGAPDDLRAAAESFRAFAERARSRPDLARQLEEVERECGCPVARRHRSLWQVDPSACVPGRLEVVTCACHLGCGGRTSDEIMQCEAEAARRLDQRGQRSLAHPP